MSVRKKKEVKRIGVSREELGECLHTALRKLCDSEPTSIAWNLIVMDAFDHAWGRYLDEVWAIFSSKHTKRDAPQLLKEASEKFRLGDPAHNALRCVFALFDDDDWKGFAGFLGSP